MRTRAFSGEPPDMDGRCGTPVWVECDCGQGHVLLEAEVGELVTPDAPRRWRVVVPFLDAGAEIPAGTRSTSPGTRRSNGASTPVCRSSRIRALFSVATTSST